MKSFVKLEFNSDDESIGLSDDNEDVEVERMLELIHDGHPFEHNTWSGGVRSSDMPVVKGKEQNESRTEEVSCEETGNPVTATFQTSPTTRQSAPSSRPSNIPPHQGRPPSGGPAVSTRANDDIVAIIREAADAFEERAHELFVREIFSLKEYIDSACAKLRVDMEAMVTSKGETQHTGGMENTDKSEPRGREGIRFIRLLLLMCLNC